MKGTGTRCSAKSKRSGERCKRWAVNRRSVCPFHGGKSLTGVAHPNFLHGRYSRHLPSRLSDGYEAALQEPEIASVRSEVALCVARQEDLLSRVDSGEAGANWRDLQTLYTEVEKQQRLWQENRGTPAGDRAREAYVCLVQEMGAVVASGASDYRAWGEVCSMIEQRRRLVNTEIACLVKSEQMVPKEKALAFVGAVVAVVRRHCPEPERLNAIGTEMTALIERELPK
ncbi:MAG: HGGxSTG domain-containing protein [Armatimonadota bacterium]